MNHITYTVIKNFKLCNFKFIGYDFTSADYYGDGYLVITTDSQILEEDPYWFQINKGTFIFLNKEINHD